MFSRFTTTPVRLFDLHIKPDGLVSDEQSSLVVDLNALRVFLPPNPDVAWQCLVGACGRAVTPMCTDLCNILNNDFQNVAQVLLDLELRHDTSQDILVSIPAGALDLNTTRPMAQPRLKSFLNKQTWSDATEYTTTSSRHVSTPTIVISLCPPQVKETSCHIPYQDRAFGNRLTVPSHPAFNKHHPPMLLDHPSLPLLELGSWEWDSLKGHWMAVLPSPTEQTKKGMFSIVMTSRRRPFQMPRRNTKASALRI